MSDASTATPDRRPAQRASGSSFYAAMRILPRAQREAMFEIYSLLPRRSTTSPTIRRPARPRGWPSCEHWRARHRRALSPAQPPPQLRGLGAVGARVRPAARGFPRRHRRHGDGRRRRHPRARSSPRSISIATASRARSAGCRCGSSAWREDDGHRARPSSRPRAAAHQHPARPRRGRRRSAGSICRARRCATPASPTTDPPTVLAASGARRGLRAAGRARRRRISPQADAIMARSPRRSGEGAAASWRRPIARSSTR